MKEDLHCLTITWNLMVLFVMQGRDCTYFRECNPPLNQVLHICFSVCLCELINALVSWFGTNHRQCVSFESRFFVFVFAWKVSTIAMDSCDRYFEFKVKNYFHINKKFFIINNYFTNERSQDRSMGDTAALVRKMLLWRIMLTKTHSPPQHPSQHPSHGQSQWRKIDN